ncbi:SRPBCC family protein [Microbacterium gallinarum]|uniref:SRPBCC family protein n=1 Tax=Microbacterium gallinarum TaxID=2762209 RepID=A0ABR8WZW9_9MICO|nr:SRPBCC family protein [Microbacterium gallinarum]MBD8022483.1 SRPBCC family protein [Microbacterium gallinarum]
MVDVNAQIGAVDRTLRTTELDGEEARVQSLAQTYPSPIDDVWDAVTTGERIARWFAPVEGDLRLGGRYQVVGNAGGEVLACTPPHDGVASYRVTWEYGGGISWLEIGLTSLGDDRTQLVLTHTAKTEGLPPGFWEMYGPGATGVGWDMGLLGLSLHLTGGERIAPEEAEAWQVSDEGKRFSRAAADGWAKAHVADGGDPDAAAAAATNTYLFYTGQTADESPEA